LSKLTQGRRRTDTTEGDLPEEIQVGDYWKILDASGAPKQSTYPTNLTGTCWHLAVPLGCGDDAYSLANLIAHTVREHDDGTISVLPGDGSSNSILVTRRPGQTWHGFVRNGVLEGDE
jgi:hypothetical protein